MTASTIEITESTESSITPIVNARDLHEFLGVGTDFSTWIRGRIVQCGFVEHQDFELQEVVDGQGRPAKEYLLSLGAAKELASNEPGEMGRKARAVFAGYERQAADAASGVPSELKSATFVCDWVCRGLGLEGQAKAAVMRSALESVAPHLAGIIPVIQAEQARPGDDQSIPKDELCSATALLRDFGVAMNAKQFNQLAQAAGLIIKEQRPGRGRVLYDFWVVTDLGLKWGSNGIPGSSKQVPPHWWKSTFMDLISVISTHKNTS